MSNVQDAHRPIDQAMTADNTPKDCLRRMWADLVHYFITDHNIGSDYVYLGLTGGSGLDLITFKQHGLLTVTETGALTPDSQRRFAAVENNNMAIIDLQSKFPSLKIYKEPIEALLRGKKLTTFPQGDDRELAKARIINLDFNNSIPDDPNTPHDRFPVVKLIKKLGVIHDEEQHDQWALCLTFNSTLTWDADSIDEARALIENNATDIDEFRDAISNFFDEDILPHINDLTSTLSCLSDSEFCSRFISVFVPKKICEELIDQKWRIETKGCYRYLSYRGAPMVSWILHFSKEPEDFPVPKTQVYSNNVTQILRNAGFINDQGDLVD